MTTHSLFVDPRISFSPSTVVSDGTNAHADKKDRPPSQAAGDQAAPPGLQAKWPDEVDKESYPAAGFPSGTSSGNPASSPPLESKETKRRICGLPAKWLFIVAGLAACTIIALAVGLGVGLGLHHS